MIALDRMPSMPVELQPMYAQLIEVVGSLPMHQEVDFSERDQRLMQYGMCDCSPQEIADDLQVKKYMAEYYLADSFRKLHKPDETASPYGVGKFTFPYLTYVGLNEGHITYPKLFRKRPRLEPVEAITLLALASKQAINKVGAEAGLSGRHSRQLAARLGEKLEAGTHQGMVGKGFMYGFFVPDVKPSKNPGAGRP